MFPWQLEKKLQQTAEWLLSKSPETEWYTPAVLTTYNPVDDNLGFELSDAVEIFDVLHRRKLLDATTETIKYQNKPKRISVYKFNLSKIAEWQELSKKSGFISLILTPTFKYILGEHPWIYALILFILSSFFTQIFSNLGDDVYFWLKGRYNKPKALNQQPQDSNNQAKEDTTKRNSDNGRIKNIE